MTTGISTAGAGKAKTPGSLEQGARARFLTLGAPPLSFRDEQGNLVQPTPSQHYAAVNRQAGLIAVSDGLAEAVAMLADVVGVKLTVDQVRVDPLAGPEQVLALRGTVNDVDAVLPVRPGEFVLRAYAVPEPETTIALTGEPLLELKLPVEAREEDGWVPAARW